MNLKPFLFSSILFTGCTALINYKEHFIQFCQQYGCEHLHHNGPEHIYRFGIFRQNLDRIFQHNSQPHTNYQLEMNAFGLLTEDEFRDHVSRYSNETRSSICDNMPELSLDNLPATKDWRQLGAVTQVKDQGKCGSCWSFSTVVGLEGWEKIHGSGTLVSLSEQQLVDCNTKVNQGCDGGLMEYAYKYVQQNQGLYNENDYPYVGTDNKCKPASSLSKKYADIHGCYAVEANNELALQGAIANFGPISVAIEADQFSFQFYKQGVYDDIKCGTNLNHGVAVVGYGIDDQSQLPYWIVKNSWGTNWGENGYIRLLRNTADTTGMCGVAMEPVFPY